jgi:hypothetical protein
MRNTTVILLFICAGLLTVSCNLNLNAPGDDNGNGSDPDTTAIYQNKSADNLPDELPGNTTEAKSADIDNDGDLDIVLAKELEPNRILINNGDATFTDESANRLPAQSNDSRSLVIADLNSNGNSDIFFAGDPINELYINNGNGTFSDLSNRIPVDQNSTSVESADVDNSGSLDLLIGNDGQNTLLMNSGNALFNDQTTQRLPLIATPTQDIKIGDVTGDGLLDIIVGNRTNNHLYVNTQAGFFADRTDSRIPFNNSIEDTRDVSIVDIDADNDNDIYFANTNFQSGSNPQDRILINDGQGFFANATDNRLPSITTSSADAEFADLNNDSDMDLIIGNYDGGIRILTNNGNGFFTDRTEDWIADDFDPQVLDIEVGDFNGDELPDIYISVRAGSDQLLIQRKNS